MTQNSSTDYARTASGPHGQQVIDLPFPLPRTHSGLPLGNGRMGALVWGSGNVLCLTISRADFWDHRAGHQILAENLFEQIKALYDPQGARSMDRPFEEMAVHRPSGAFRNTRLPSGRYEFHLAHDCVLSRAMLDVSRGQLLVKIFRATDPRDVFNLTFTLHPQHDILHLHDPSQLTERVVPRPAWEWIGTQLLTRGYEPPTMLEKTTRRDTTGWVQTVPGDQTHASHAMATMCQQHEDGWWVVMAAGDNATTASQAGDELLGQAAVMGNATFTEQTHAWWEASHGDLPRVQLPDAFFNDFLKLAQYKFAAATSPLSRTPCALQGPWCEEYQLPPWSGDYHFNVNVQQIYTLALTSGMTSHMLPLFDMLQRCSPVFQANAKAMVGIDDGLLMTHTTDDRGYACGGIGPGASIDHAVSGWTAMLFWQYYQYTGDRVFLRERALPFLNGVMRVFDAMLEKNNGELSLPVSISAEYAHTLANGEEQRVGPDASYQFACMHMLCNALNEAAAVLGDEPDPRWKYLSKMLRPYTLTGKPGSERIAIWRDQDLEVSHRHHSHLACIYPFDTLHKRSPETQEIIDRTLRRWLEVGMSDWSEWSLPWAAIIQAREGYSESPYLLLKICKELYINEGMATVYIPQFEGFTTHGRRGKGKPLEACEVMQLDGTMGIATALYEMLVHTHRGVTRFFPAVPKPWQDVRFEDVRLPGPLLASGEMTAGKIRHITLQSKIGGAVTIDLPGHRQLVLERQGKQQTVNLPHTLTLHAGQYIKGTPVANSDGH